MTDKYEGNKEYYLRSWELILKSMLKWSEAQVLEWIEQWRDHLTEPSMLYHETPMYYVAPLFIPESIKETLSSRDYTHLLERIEMAIQDGKSFPSFDENYDWNAAVNRVGAVLKEHGCALPPSE